MFLKFQESFFKAVKDSIFEMKEDKTTTYNRGEEKRTFKNIQELTGNDTHKIAFEIYANIVLDKQVSKSIVTQYFVNSLEEEIDKIENNGDGTIKTNSSTFDKKYYTGKNNSINYLINAIKYVVGE